MTRIISIDGNIGAGKSSFVSELKSWFSNIKNCNGLKICFLQEPVDIWNTITDKQGKTMIENFYSNPDKYAFAFQMMAYISRLSIIKKEFKVGYDIIFTERCVFTDRNVFAKMLYDDGKISEVEFKIYNAWFNEFINDFPKIEYIYLQAKPETAAERIRKRNRVGENIPIEYLYRCHEYHENWLENITNKCVIDCNTDIIENPKIISEWIKSVETFITHYTVTFDGASRGNPGLCGAGFVIWNNDNKIFSGSQFLSKSNTNNFAEYSALIYALKKCNELNIKHLIIKGDCELVIKQASGEYNVNSTNLITLRTCVVNELANFTAFKFIHIPRNENKDADLLANQAIDDELKNEHEYMENLN